MQSYTTYHAESAVRVYTVFDLSNANISLTATVKREAKCRSCPFAILLFCTFHTENVQFGNYFENRLSQTISEFCSGRRYCLCYCQLRNSYFIIVIDGKNITIKITTMAYIVMMFVRRFMTICRFVFRFISGVLEPHSTRSLGMFFFYKGQN